MKWEVSNLKDYCEINQKLFPSDKIEYFNNKIERYYLIRDEIDTLPAKYFEMKKTSQKLGTNMIYLNYSYSNLFELTSTIICSLFDIMGFIINTLLFRDQLKDHEVSFKKISKLVNKEQHYVKTKEMINNIEKEYSYLYFNAFNNIIKHRGIIKNNYKLGRGDTFIDDLISPYIKSFNYYERKYDESTANQFFQYGNNNIKILIELGSILNDEIIS